MKGGSVAYHLRPNKSIERQLFVEVLTRFHAFKSLHDYTYVGFGGPFLEDFKLLEHHFELARLISIEGDPAVLQRQEFNRPFSKIECRHQRSDALISNFSGDVSGPSIVWLDYAEANARRAQLGEFQSLLGKLGDFDIVKLTLNANPATIPTPAGTKQAELAAARLAAAEQALGDYWHPAATALDMTRKNFPNQLLRCAIRAAHQALPPGRRLEFAPLTSFVYADSEHSMLTLTAALVPASELPRFRGALRLRNWNLAFASDTAPIRIAAPMLSTRERIHIESLLPRFRRSIATRVKFSVAEDPDDSKELLASFATFSRYYPHFSKVVL